MKHLIQSLSIATLLLWGQVLLAQAISQLENYNEKSNTINFENVQTENAQHLEINDSKSEHKLINSYINIASNYIDLNKNDSAKYYLDLAFNIAEKNKLYRDISAIYLVYHSIQDDKKSKDNIHSSIYYASKISYLEGLCNAYHELGLYFSENEIDKDSAEYYFREAIVTSYALRDTLSAIHNMSHLAILEKKDEYKNIGHDCKEIFKTKSKINNKVGIKQSLQNLAKEHLNNGNPELAENMLLYILPLVEKSNDLRDKAKINIDIAKAQLAQRKYDASKEFYFRSLEIYTSLDDTLGQAYTNLEIGKLFFEMEEYRNSVEYFLIAENLNNYIDDEFHLIETLSCLGKSYFYIALDIQNDKQESRNYFNMALDKLLKVAKLTEKNQIQESLAEVYENIYKIYLELNQKELAFDYLLLHDQVEDTFKLRFRESEILRISNKYKNELNSKEIQILIEKEKLEKAEDKIDITYLYLTVLAIISILIVVIGLYHRYRFITKTYELISKKNKYITDSIKYARNIQRAILPEEDFVKQIFPDFFIFYRPKDIVSGDFYWFSEVNGVKFAAVVDCTGHGVPGAFMSMIGNQLLNKIINEDNIKDPAEILNLLDKGIMLALHNENLKGIGDGMDLGLICYDGNKISFAGAKQNLYIANGDGIVEIKGTRKSIGSGIGYNKKYQSTEIEVHSDTQTLIYLACDGYLDQNDVNRKKFGKRRFLKLLEEINDLSIEEQMQEVERNFDKFRSGEEQRDDVTFLGLKIN